MFKMGQSKRFRGFFKVSEGIKLLFLICIVQLDTSHGKIQSWERTCVVGDCVQANSAFRSCSSQSQDIKLAHPSNRDVLSESVFKNRPSTLSVESCGGSGANHHRHNNRRGSRQATGGEFIPLCCPSKKTEEGMMVAGLGAGINEFPHQVRLLIRSPSGVKEKCGGTIYNKDYILTAASCLVYNGQFVKASDVEVITGQNLEHTRIPRNIHTVRDIKIHEGYRGGIHGYGRDNDIALLTLSNHLDFPSNPSSPQLKALRIAEKGFRADGRSAIILGWGRTAVREKPIGALLKMNSHINTHDECIEKSQQALNNGNDFRKARLDESSHDEHGDPDAFEISKRTFSSKSRDRSGSGRHSIFDDPFFSRPWNSGGGSSLSEWEQSHKFVNMGGLNLGRLWAGGVEYKNKKGSHLTPLSQFPPSLLCIGGGSNSTGYNRGDTGGPAICEGADGSPVLCGISSYGRNEFRGEWPATYVNVAHYTDWIHKNTGRAHQPDDILIKDVIDGEPVSSLDEANFFIRIRNKKTNTTCGGALINSKTVISSVSCVPLDVRTDDLVVTSGELSVEQKGTDHEVDGVATRETYKSYQSRSENRRGSATSSESSEVQRTSLKGDFPQLNLAILKLSRPVRNRNVKPIDLIKPRMERMIVYEYGWRTDGRDKSLNKWAYREIQLEECRERYGAAGIQIDEHHLCAQEVYTGGERCNKELGNPLVCLDRQGKKYLCGVTSIRDCAFAFPTVFTNVVQNLDWIQL